MQDPSANLSPANSAQGGSTAESLVTQGREYYAKGELQAALACFHNAHDAAQGEGRDALVAEIANDTGVVYIVLRQWQEAEQWLSKAQRLFIDLHDYDGEAQTLGNIGSMYRAQGDLSQAAAHLQLAADRLQLVGGSERRAATLRLLAIVRLRQLRFLQALSAYESYLACRPDAKSIHRLLRRFLSLPLRLMRG